MKAIIEFDNGSVQINIDPIALSRVDLSTLPAWLHTLVATYRCDMGYGEHA